MTITPLPATSESGNTAGRRYDIYLFLFHKYIIIANIIQILLKIYIYRYKSNIKCYICLDKVNYYILFSINNYSF